MDVRNAPTAANEPETRNDGPRQNRSPPLWISAAKTYFGNINVSDTVERAGNFGWTRLSKIAVTIIELRDSANDAAADIVFFQGKADFTTDGDTELRMHLDGIHVTETGVFVGIATPFGQVSDIRILPSLVHNDIMNETEIMVTQELDKRIKKLNSLIDTGSPDEDNLKEESETANCHFTFHFQLRPSHVIPKLLEELETELENPSGLTTIPSPPLYLDGVFISKSCGIFIETKGMKGLKLQKFWQKATTYAGYAFVVYLGLLVLLMRQMESSSGRTPAGVSRISRWTMIIQAIADGISFIGHLTFGILFSEHRSSLSLLAPGFLACLLLVYETRYAILIRQVQGPEDVILRESIQSNDIRSADGSTVSARSDNGNDDQRPTGFIQAFKKYLRLLTRSWFFILISLIFFFDLILTSVVMIVIVGCVYTSFWIPQIYRSAVRGSRPGLSMEYMIGGTLGRLFFALYIFGCPENVLGVQTSRWAYLSVLLLSLQVAIILCQESFGPSFFVPQRSYDYHPSITMPDAEAPKQTLGDCAICMEPILVQQQEPFVSAPTNLLRGNKTRARKEYAWAPCNHIFHSDCLETWLAIKASE
ncbi:hypothetical protein Clacol_005549 [Clathrus columnatus]|uniref:RING-type E3 ubiquitin transferase n=1 Tax=Clathrus columnatus TaxID=1419009 RepID=A0AAV5ACB4_9AGAM|nr:hypothetical protein Clacol_005549 [Clathrus columnatus]